MKAKIDKVDQAINQGEINQQETKIILAEQDKDLLDNKIQYVTLRKEIIDHQEEIPAEILFDQVVQGKKVESALDIIDDNWFLFYHFYDEKRGISTNILIYLK